MGTTNLDSIDSLVNKARIGTTALRPATPLVWYGSTVQDFESRQWKGGELYYSSDDNVLQIQVATSGVGAGTWEVLLTAFNTTTSTSTSTSTSSSTSSSSSTSTTTSTSTSTSSSTSTSTSTSSTTTT